MKIQKKNNDRFQQVLPLWFFNIIIFNNKGLKLKLKWKKHSTKYKQFKKCSDNKIEYISSDNLWKVCNFGIYFKNLNANIQNDSKYKSNFQSELNIYELNTRYPLFKENKFSNYITPKISFRLNPSDMKNYSTEIGL